MWKQRKRSAVLAALFVHLSLIPVAVGQGPVPPAAPLLDLAQAVVVTPSTLSVPEQTAVRVLVEEVARRTRIELPVSAAWPADDTPAIVVAPASAAQSMAGPFSERIAGREVPGPEGYRISVERGNRAAPAVFVVGHDARGVLFGVGRLLREMRMTPARLVLPAGFEVETAPRNPLRGHQLGYRPKTNSYDGWDVARWEQYIRDLAIFGNNAVELIAPRSDDADESPHFPLPKMDMMVEMSRIADEYGMDVWIWYPALDPDYADPVQVQAALDEWEAVFEKLPRIDAVFVPGGDPGHTPPGVMFALLEQQTAVLHRHHPDAGMWMSPQGFTAEWMNEFYELVRKEPSWLSGIVFGPQVRVSLPELRARVPERYPIRRYPDITHSLRSQYPVPDWDVAHAITSEREPINPRPVSEARIFRALDQYSRGFITYSEGCNDDVNKIVWSVLGWDPEADVLDALRQYSRYFLGERYTDSFAQGLFALERNWQGPIRTNGAIYTTLQQFQDMEQTATPQDLLNWRFQQALYRAYYDAYQRSRFLYEQQLEERAMEPLRTAPQVGAAAAIEEALEILERADLDKPSDAWRRRIDSLAEALFQSARMQFSVDLYQAISVGRGATLDRVDYPLNDRVWLKARLSGALTQEDEEARLATIDTLVTWSNPGPGGYYDDLGNPSRQPHLVRGPGREKDPGAYESVAVGFGYRPGWRLSWITHAESFYDAPVRMRYTGLDPDAHYRVRVVYAGDIYSQETRIRLVANDGIEVHPPIPKPRPVRPVQFDVPVEATRGGELTLTWTQEAGRGGSGRGCQIAEVWLIRAGTGATNDRRQPAGNTASS